MAPQDRRPDLPPFAARLISFKAWQVTRKHGFTVSDRPDIEQELALDLLRRLPRFDPARASEQTFIRRVVENAVATLLEARSAARRDHRRHGSLQEEINDCEGNTTEMGETLDEAVCRARRGLPVRDELGAADLKVDLERALGTLPPHLQDLARRLQEETPTEVARALGVPRTTLLKRLDRIRAHLERAGLAKFASTRRHPAGGPGR